MLKTPSLSFNKKMDNYNFHQPVLIEEVLSFVKRESVHVLVDMTLGRAGHSSRILELLADSQNPPIFYGFDKDAEAISYCKDRLSFFSDRVKLKLIQAPYSEAVSYMKEDGIKGADLVLFDIGVSSPQFDNPNRGFSYRFDSTLDMRMDQRDSKTAADIINTYSESELIRVFRDLGECRHYKKVVENIIAKRQKKPIETTFELVDIIKSSLPPSELKKEGHPAKQFFLGLRYEVNSEIDELKKGLQQTINFLNPGGVIIIITFNSEEDKIVKDLFNKVSKKQVVIKNLPPVDYQVNYLQLTKKPIKASEVELKRNNRAKPALLRALERKANNEGQIAPNWCEETQSRS